MNEAMHFEAIMHDKHKEFEVDDRIEQAYRAGYEAGIKKAEAAEEKHWNECRQISEYEAENKALKEQLKQAVEDFKVVSRQFEDEDGHCVSSISCDKCRLNGGNLADECQWIHTEEAMKLINEVSTVSSQ